MSLKGMHLLFIALSSLLGLLFGVWALRAPDGGLALRGLGGFSLALAAALVVYGVWFLRKIRTREEEERRRRRVIRPLGVAAVCWAAGLDPAGACSVCYGQAEGPLIDAARLGVWLLFGLVLAVQAAFVLFFLRLRRRAREHERRPARPGWAR